MRMFEIDQTHAAIHDQRIVRAGITVDETLPGTGITKQRREQFQFAGRRRSAERTDDDIGFLLHAPPRRLQRTACPEDGLKRVMMRCQAIGRIGVEPAECGRVEAERALRLRRGSFEQGIDERGEIRAQIFEDQKAV